MPPPIAFISDIHGNLPALQAVLADISGQGVSEIICLGDVVGYGGQPAACLELLRERQICTLQGNHDAYVSNEALLKEAGDGFMGSMWQWTRNSLSLEQLQWLASLPLTLERPDFQAVHATLRHPEDWEYVLSVWDAEVHFAYQTKPLCFIGHTHRPACWLAGKDSANEITSIEPLSKTEKQLINVGSVGQPRDGDNRACYLLYRPDDGDVWWRRVTYDIAASQHAIMDAGLPIKFADRLRFGK